MFLSLAFHVAIKLWDFSRAEICKIGIDRCNKLDDPLPILLTVQMWSSSLCDKCGVATGWCNKLGGATSWMTVQMWW